MKQILQSSTTGAMWLADVPAPLCPARGRVAFCIEAYFLDHPSNPDNPVTILDLS